MRNKIIVFVGGYAEAGKTTTLNRLKDEGLTVFSSSELLHSVTWRIVAGILGTDKANQLENKAKNYSLKTLLGIDDTVRGLYILIAEAILVPVFGREIFAHTVARKALQASDDLVFIETIGGREHALAEEHIQLLNPTALVLNLNLRRVGENKEADSRQLLPDLEGKTIEIWVDKHPQNTIVYQILSSIDLVCLNNKVAL